MAPRRTSLVLADDNFVSVLTLSEHGQIDNSIAKFVVFGGFPATR